MNRLGMLILVSVALILPQQALTQEIQISCSVYPSSLDFGTVKVGLSNEIYFSITNTGDETLSGTVMISCEDFSIVSGSGSYSLGVGQSRFVTVRFAPTSIGSKTCIIETGHGACSDVNCTGRGDTAPACFVDPASLDFGRVDEGQWHDRSFTITNVGGGALGGSVSASCEEFNIVSGDGSYNLAAGQSRTVTVRFAPTSMGIKNCTIETGNNSCPDVSCTGVSGVLPACSVDPEQLDFGSVSIGAWLDLDFTITNVGGGTIDGAVGESCEQYSIVSGGGSYSLGAGQSLMVTVRFTPAASGSASCTIETGDDLCIDVGCSGTGVIPPSCSLSAENLDFGTVDLGDWEDRNFTITNTGGGTLNGSVNESCEQYSIVSGGGTYSLGAGQSRTVTVRFTPTFRGSTSCTIETGDDLCADVACSAVGEMPPSCSVSPMGLDFGIVTVGDSMDLDFSITNVGGRTVSGSVSESCEDYSIVSGSGPYSLGAGQSLTVTVRFVATSIGSMSCIIETGVDLCTDVTCFARGDILPACSVDPTNLSFGMVDVGESTERSFVITNTGGMTLDGLISESCSHYSLVSGGGLFSLQADESRTVTVQFSPTSQGNKSCTVETGSSLCSHVSCFGTGGNLPSCSVYPTDLDFGTVTVGLSRELSFTISNTGGGRLNGSVTAACEDFSVVSGGGSYSLGAGQSRIVTVQFAPLSVGDRTCTIQTGDSLCVDVDCSGRGKIQTSCTVEPENLDFGTVIVGAWEELTFTITNTGDEPLNGVVGESCEAYIIIAGSGSYSLAKGESRVIWVRFAPVKEGSTTCTIETGSGLCSDVLCSGVGEGFPTCSVEPTSLDFGTVSIGFPAELDFTITNMGGGRFSGWVSESCADFSIISGGGSFTLDVGRSRTVTVRFIPVSVGSTQCIIGTGVDLCADVRCSGLGEPPPSCSVEPANLNFGMVDIDDSAALDVTITNTGGGILSGNVSERCEDFRIISGGGPYSLGGGQSRIVTVSFTPAAAGSTECTIRTGTDLCADVICSGIGVEPPSCSVDPESLDFGTVNIGNFEALPFTITNTGGGSLIGSVSASCADFIIVSGSGPYSLGPGGSLTVTVWFTPLSQGTQTCVIEPGTDLCDSVICTGVGAELPWCSVEPESLDFGTVDVGGSLSLDFTITNTGDGTLSGSVGAACEDFSIVSGGGSYDLGAGGFRMVTVRFMPTTSGSASCTIETGTDLCSNVLCAGIGEMPPACTVDPETLDFGTVEIGDTEEGHFTITNTGGGMLHGTVSESCEQYTLLSGGGSYTLRADESWDVTISFGPVTLGAQSCTVALGSDGGICGDVICSGSGVVQNAVTLLDYCAVAEHGCVSLSWNVHTDVDVVEFIICRSDNNTVFETIGNLRVMDGGTRDSYLDCDVKEAGMLYYKLSSVGTSGSVEEIGRTSIQMTQIVSELLVDVTNCPNPFNATTDINYFLTAPSSVQLTIYNTLGQEVDVLIHHHQHAGRHVVSWSAQGVPSGVYVYRIQAGNAVMARKMLLLR